MGFPTMGKSENTDPRVFWECKNFKLFVERNDPDLVAGNNVGITLFIMPFSLSKIFSELYIFTKIILKIYFQIYFQNLKETTVDNEGKHALNLPLA